jgi:two-component system, NarL family, sensor histidine kinase UhpB
LGRSTVAAMSEVLETTPAAPADHPSRVALAAQEAERKRVARELHDEVSQGLVAVALMAEQAAANPPDDPSGRFAEIARRVHFYLDELRRIAHELRPEMLDDLGLEDALVALAAGTARDRGIVVDRRLPRDLGPLTGEQELVVYRVAQEALGNVARHSGAARAAIGIDRRGDLLTLEVSDDGRGIDPGQEPGDGIKGMRERAALVGGRVEIGPGADAGTRVRLLLPVEAS